MSRAFAGSGLTFWLAWSLWVLFITLAAGLVLLGFLNGAPNAWGQALGLGLITIFPTMGALVAARRPDNPMGWLILAIALSFASSSFTYQYALYALITATVREQVDLGSLTGSLLGVVDEAMQPAQISLWIKPVVGRKDE